MEKGEGFHMIKAEVIPGFLLVLMGSIDCLTTVIGVMYFGAVELNPFMAGAVNTGIGAFLAIKIASTLLIALTYVIATKTLQKYPNKTTKSFKISNKMLKIGYGGIIAFLCIVVANNLIILLA
jgi:hypothetical protein